MKKSGGIIHPPSLCVKDLVLFAWWLLNTGGFPDFEPDTLFSFGELFATAWCFPGSILGLQEETFLVLLPLSLLWIPALCVWDCMWVYVFVWAYAGECVSMRVCVYVNVGVGSVCVCQLLSEGGGLQLEPLTVKEHTHTHLASCQLTYLYWFLDFATTVYVQVVIVMALSYQGLQKILKFKRWV